MKNLILLFSTAALFGFSQIGYAGQQGDSSQALQQQYAQLVESGKSYRDSYQALAIEIAYEMAAVQASQPCRKMVRGL